MHFLLFSMSVVYVLTTPISKDGDDATVEQLRKRAKWDNDDYVCRGLILKGMSNPLFDIYQNVESRKELCDSLEAKYMAEDASSKKFLKDFKHTLKHNKEELTLVELGSHLRIEESLRVQDNDKPKGNTIVGPLVVNMVEHNNSSRYTDNRGKRKHHDTKSDSNKKSKDDDVAWWVDSGTIVHVCKDRCWFKTYESLKDGFILHMRNESTALVHGRGCVDLKFSSGKIASLLNVLHVPNIRKNLFSSSVLNNYGYKQVNESDKFVLSKHGVFIGFGYLSNQMFRLNIVNDNIALAFMSTSKLDDSILWNARLGHDEELDKFKVFKTEIELQGSQIKRFRTDRGGEYMDTLYFQSVSIIHETTAPYTPQQNGISERKNRVLKEMVNSMLSYSGLSQGFWGENMLTACNLLNSLPNKRNRITPYELWTKRKPNLNYLKVWGYRTVVRLSDPKLKTLGERGIACIFIGYAKHSKAFRSLKTLMVQWSLKRSLKRDDVSDQHSYCFNVEDDPKTFDEAMKSQDVAFWKEEINDEMDSILGNNTWVLADLPPGCKPLG
ncbi:zinc finger, CCHC-type containing protein [Tanacetum coccineum]